MSDLAQQRYTNNVSGKINMKQNVYNFKNKHAIHYWAKILFIGVLGTIIFYSTTLIFTQGPEKKIVSIPPNWHKIELALHGNYLAQEGEIISVLENSGNVLLSKALLVEIKKSELQEIDGQFNNLWKVLLAIEPIDHQKLKLLNMKKPEQLYISPLVRTHTQIIHKIAKENHAYEITY